MRALAVHSSITVRCCVLTLLIVSVKQSAWGQDRRVEPAKPVLINDLAASHPASAYINPATMIVAEIDWKKIDVDQFFTVVQKLTGDRPSDTPLVKRLFSEMSKAGAGNVYLFADSSTFSDGIPLFVIPSDDPDKLMAAIENVLGKCPPQVKTLNRSGALVIGTHEQVRRFESSDPTNRDDILIPLRDGKRLDHTAVISVPKSARSILGKLWPQRSIEGLNVKLSPRELAEDIKRIVVTFRTPPNPLVRIHLEAVDDSAAERVSKQFAALKQQFRDVLADVTIKREQNEVILEADDNAFEFAQAVAVNARKEASESRTVSTLKQLGVAFYSYEGKAKHLPPRCFVNPDGTPLHSWLVAVLPYFNQQALYRSLKLNRAWDHDDNSMIQRTVPAGIGRQTLPVAHTTIRAPVFPGSLWHGDGPPKKLSEITDDTSKTIFLIDAPATASVHWADPTPWVISKTDPVNDVFGDRDRARFLFADGSVRLIKRDEVDNKSLSAMLTIAGDE